MKKRSRFLFEHKVVLFNLLLFAFMISWPVGILESKDNNPDFNYYAGVVILLGLFFEFTGIWYKSRFIYSHKRSNEAYIPFLFRIAIWPRLLFSILLFGLALKAMGVLSRSDFWLIVMVFYGGAKEFWVRKVLLKPEESNGSRDPQWKILMGEVMLFIFICIAYVTLWSYYLLQSEKIIMRIIYPSNYAFAAIGFIVFITSVMMPMLVEEYLREKTRGRKIFAFLSCLLPVSAFIFQVYKLGFLS
jgi:hypothetical protein